MNAFEHESLHVYQAAIEFLVLADAIAAARVCAADKARFYRIAQRSATESAAIIDGGRALGLHSTEALERGRTVLLRIVAMLTAMVVKSQRSGSGSGSEAETWSRL